MKNMHPENNIYCERHYKGSANGQILKKFHNLGINH